MTVTIENEASFLTAMRSRFNLFAGAGFSVLAQSAAGPLPVGGALAGELRTRFGVDAGASLDLPQLHTLINASHPQELDEYIRERFKVSTLDDRYAVIEKLAPQAIFTTNVDDLFQNIFRNSQSHYLNDVYAQGASLSTRTAVELIQLHGAVSDTTRTLTFGTLDIAAAASRDPDKWAFLRQRLAQSPTLYWGYSMSDSGTLQSLRTGNANPSTIGDAWIQIRPNSAETALADYFRALNLQIIVADTGDLLEYLSHKSPSGSERIELAEPALENLPPTSDVAARPLEDYFLGAAPSWSDIYGGGLQRTSHYRTIADRVAAGRNTVVAGIPASGKTTLLMQVAAHAPFDGPRLMFDGLNAAEAGLIRRRIGNGRALVVLDNVASDADSLSILAGAPNAVIVAADRDYTLSSVTNIVSRSRTEIIGVTALTNPDLQAIWHSIPLRIRSKRLQMPPTTSGVALSALEFIKGNVSGQLLGERLADHVSVMLKEDPDQAHILILACYLHSARVPLSMDVALAFFRDRITDYRTIYAMLESVGALLQEYEGVLDQNDQDYFSARSMIVSETVIDGVASSALRAVLQRFHTSISPLRVPGFKTFKRRGYDFRLFTKAFPRFHEGIELYNHILEKPEIDRDPYVVQHKALFLAEHRQFEDAFREIDRARGARNRKQVNWTIENSYNKILFRANIDKADRLTEAAELCARALSGLREAYEKDSRKGTHALVYADSAIRFSRAILTEETVSQLELALEMLTEVISSESWLDRPKYARGDVQRRLRELC